ncbi:MAG: UDP-N-acetylglucosamine 2-epimerase (non-hydrolyzing) [Candidatus Omnitrophica bacterium]|nr:UDP-N-acetylglucosamine 2-epimerase (non-hydrolyzing) [Candidatus Omnitrophota bacterium]
MKKILVIFGTRPEAIKLAPVISALKKSQGLFKTVVCVTGQHRQMLDQVLRLFHIKPQYDLDIMSKDQTLIDVTTRTLLGLKEVLTKQKPHLMLVQGDTTAAFAASLAAFYYKIPLGHIEAGLRTYNKYQPFPEEKNRHMIGVLADYHFAPTPWARQNLLQEGVSRDRVWVTGNTGIDALLDINNQLRTSSKQRHWSSFFKDQWGLDLSKGRKLVLVTGHRRENFGEGFEHICYALKSLAQNNKDVDIVYPVHLNPNVRKPVFDILGQLKNNNLHLIDPLEYEPFVFLMNASYVILTDSGGIQEEAPSLGKPVLVMRQTTERPEGVDKGLVKLVGTNKNKIVTELERLLKDRRAYQQMSKKANPYGDGKASEKIIKILKKVLK